MQPPAAATHATLMLVFVTFLWGSSFPLMKVWLQAAAAACPGGEALALFTFIGVRYLAALAGVFALRPSLILGPTRREHGLGAVIGLLYLVGSTPQAAGLLWTTPALSAFITSLASAWVPIIAFCCFRTAVPLLTLLGLALGIGGTALLSNGGSQGQWAIGWGEGLTLVSSIVFAFEILLLDRWGRQVRPAHFTVGLLGVTGLCGVVITMVLAAGSCGFLAWLEWVIRFQLQPAPLATMTALLFTSIFSFYWMNVYQPRVSASRAALIYLLEPIFAALFSIPMGQDALTLHLVLGGGLILAGNLLVEATAWRRNRRNEIAN